MANSRVSKLWKPKGNEVKQEDIEQANLTKDNLADILMVIHKDEITYRFIMNAFGAFDGTSVVNPYDLLEVPAGKFSFYTDKEKKKYKSNKNQFTTTIGLFIFNIFLRDFNFSRLFDGYMGETINDHKNSAIEKRLSFALVEDDITTIDLKEWEDTMEWFMPFESVLAPNHTEKMIACTRAIDKKKQELMKKYKDQIAQGDPVIAEKMEKELLDFAKEYMGDDPSMDTVVSGASGSFKNNFKNMFVMKGAIRNPDPYAKQKYRIVTGNYIDGIPANEYSAVAGSGVAGAYSRGKKTETGGYYEKLFVAAYQNLHLDPKGSDCGTKKHITVELTEKNIDLYMYCYIIKSNGELELLDTKTRDKYIGKKVNMRFASMCESKTGICNKCAGELFYSLQDYRIGINLSAIPTTMKLRAMKGFHDSTVQTVTIDPIKAFFPFEDK